MTAGVGLIYIKPLYVILMKNGLGNQKVCKTLIKHGHVYVNNIICMNTMYAVQINDIIHVDNQSINSHPFVYIMMNKPKGYICSNQNEKYPSVFNLIDRKDCHCVGRLDHDTTGLLLITNDQSLSKRLLLPQNHIEKYYEVKTLKPLNENIIQIFYQGVIIDNDYQCLSSDLTIIDDYHCIVKICEGKYHQIKKMFLSCQNKVISLKRIQFHHLTLDPYLDEGEYRLLSYKELELIS
ncbi:MAG: 16S rRNA pseudouridine(516) synthase [Erysipelotrichaceae bacterium]|nr:16S rRNA pseudouridine(516) synthase [Erysipelotrichaceae bacterium]